MLRFILILAVVVVNQKFGYGFKSRFQSSLSSWISSGIVDELIPNEPPQKLKVEFDGQRVNLGNFFTPMEVQNEPKLKWYADPNKKYTIVFTDPDNFSREKPTLRHYIHWLVGNVPGYDIKNGETLISFFGSAPAEKSGMHRYIFLVYEQPGYSSFTGVPRIDGRFGKTRGNFELDAFVKHFGLKLVAGNFYMSQNPIQEQSGNSKCW